MGATMADVILPRWHVCLCPNPNCGSILFRASRSDIVLNGVLEFACNHSFHGRRCHQRSVLGGPDYETPPRPQVVIVRDRTSGTLGKVRALLRTRQ